MMNLTQLANLGEFIGGVAVLVTLIYLAVQVRQSNQLEKRQGDRDFTRLIDRVWFEPMRDPARAALLQGAARDFDSLDLRDQGAVNAVWSPMMVAVQEMRQLSQDGVVISWAPSAESFVVSFLQMPGASQWWERAKAMFPPDFATDIDTRIRSSERPAALHTFIPWFIDATDVTS